MRSVKETKNLLKSRDARFLTDWYHLTTYPLKNYDYFEDYNKNDFTYIFFNPISGLYKIGRSQNIYRRLSVISTQSGCDCILLMAISGVAGLSESSVIIESRLHEFFKAKRILGEWFKLSWRDLFYIRELFYSIADDDELFHETINRPSLSMRK